MSESTRPNPKPIEELIGETIGGRYLLVAPQIRGSLGQTYKAVQQPLDRIVGLKILSPRALAAAERGFRERFLQEAALAAKLSHHNTAKTIDFGESDELLFVAMEWLDGVTLRELLSRRGKLPWESALSVALSICRSLREAHKAGVLHRNLKPSNVLVLDEKEPESIKVLDYGLARCFVPDGFTGNLYDLAPPSVMLGAPEYMAPEQAQNQADARSDLYSLGALLYEMLTGRPPFSGRSFLELATAHAQEPVPAMGVAPPNVEALVMRCLSKDPADRFESAEALADVLRAFLEGGTMPSLARTEQIRLSAGSRDKLAAAAATMAPLPERPATDLMTTAPVDAESVAIALAQAQQLVSNRPASAPLPVVSAKAEPASTPAPPPVPAPAPAKPPATLVGPASYAAPTEVIPISKIFPPPPLAGGPLFGNVAGKTNGAALPEPTRSQPMATLFSGALGAKKKSSSMPWLLVGAAAIAAVVYFAWPRSHPSAAVAALPAPIAPSTAVDAGAPTLAASPPKPSKVKVHVESTPAGARISLGGKALGVTPTDIELEKNADGSASAELTFEKEGYASLTASIGGAGAGMAVKQKLEKLKATPPAKVAHAKPPPKKPAPVKPVVAKAAPVKPPPAKPAPASKHAAAPSKAVNSPQPAMAEKREQAVVPAIADQASPKAVPAVASSRPVAPEPAAAPAAVPLPAPTPAPAAPPAASTGGPVRNVPPFVLDRALVSRTPPVISDAFKQAHPNASLVGVYKVCVGSDGHVTSVTTVKSLGSADSDISQGIRSGWQYQPAAPACAMYSIPVKTGP